MEDFKKKDIAEFNNEELLNAFYWLGVKTTKQSNSTRGISKATIKQEQWIVEELSKRFNLDGEKLKGMLNK